MLWQVYLKYKYSDRHFDAGQIAYPRDTCTRAFPHAEAPVDGSPSAANAKHIVRTVNDLPHKWPIHHRIIYLWDLGL